ncbi:MAG: cation transporter [Pseudomonadota bacterium]
MIELKVEGMTCGHCEAAVKRALEAVPGVTTVLVVDRHTARVVVEGDADVQALVAAVKEEGYQASPVVASAG